MVAALSAAMCITAVSCGDDESEEPGAGNVTSSPSLSDFGGVRLSKVSYDSGDNTYEYFTSFDYNSYGLLTRVVDGNDQIIFDYQKATLSFVGDDYRQDTRFTTDTKGHLTGFTFSDKDEEGYTGVLTYTFRYDDADHLLHAEYNSVSTSPEGSTSSTTIITFDFTWDGDLLTKSVCNGEESGSAYTKKWKSTSTYSYTDAPDNRYMQYTSRLVSDIDLDSSIEPIMHVGMLGKGPAKYPTHIKQVRDSGTEETAISYILNSWGLVEVETSTSAYGTGSTKYTYSDPSK